MLRTLKGRNKRGRNELQFLYTILIYLEWDGKMCGIDSYAALSGLADFFSQGQGRCPWLYRYRPVGTKFKEASL